MDSLKLRTEFESKIYNTIKAKYLLLSLPDVPDYTSDDSIQQDLKHNNGPYLVIISTLAFSIMIFTEKVLYNTLMELWFSPLNHIILNTFTIILMIIFWYFQKKWDHRMNLLFLCLLSIAAMGIQSTHYSDESFILTFLSVILISFVTTMIKPFAVMLSFKYFTFKGSIFASGFQVWISSLMAVVAYSYKSEYPITFFVDKTKYFCLSLNISVFVFLLIFFCEDEPSVICQCDSVQNSVLNFLTNIFLIAATYVFMFTFSDVWYQLINNILYESTDTEQQEHSIILCQWIIKATSILGILYSCINYIRLFQTMHIAISSKLASLFCFMFLVYILDNKPSGKLSIYYPSLATFIGLSLSWSTQILLLCLGAKILSPYSSLSTVVIIIIIEKSWNSAINLYIHILDIKKNNLRVLLWPKLMVLSELISIICFYYGTQKRKNVSLSRDRSF